MSFRRPHSCLATSRSLALVVAVVVVVVVEREQAGREEGRGAMHSLRCLVPRLVAIRRELEPQCQHPRQRLKQELVATLKPFAKGVHNAGNVQAPGLLDLRGATSSLSQHRGRW